MYDLKTRKPNGPPPKGIARGLAVRGQALLAALDSSLDVLAKPTVLKAYTELHDEVERYAGGTAEKEEEE